MEIMMPYSRDYGTHIIKIIGTYSENDGAYLVEMVGPIHWELCGPYSGNDRAHIVEMLRPYRRNYVANIVEKIGLIQ